MPDSGSAPASRVVLITGCSSGIGRSTAIRLATDGWIVYATARRLDRLADAAAAGCRTLALDVTSETSMQDAVAAIEGEHGAVGALVNNAGYSQSGAIEAVPIERVRAQFETNVFGLARLTQIVMPGMRRRRSGRIVNLSSMGGRLVFPGGGYYHATKYAIEALSDALRFEARAFGIDVIVIQPGLIRTAFADTVTSEIQAHEDVAHVYGPFHEAVAQATRDAYATGLVGRLAASPDAVAATIARALSARRPRTRYRTPWSAGLLMGLRRAMGDRGWDWAMRQLYPSPGAPPSV